MKHLFLSLLCLWLSLPLQAQNKIKVACVGNSVTYGYKLPQRELQAYPVQLQQMLGNHYDVQNFGHSGATLLFKGHNPYVKLPEFKAALKFKADLVVIHLGLNDTDPRNWPHYSDEFIPNYHALIDSFKVANPHAKIWVCLLSPIFHDHPRFDSGTRLWHEQIQERIRQIARTQGVGLIDLYTPLHIHPNLFPDALHPNAEGAQILARTVYSSITGNYGGLALPPTYGNNMVIQRHRPITFNGTANAGERVNINFGKHRTHATANANGQWSVTLPAQAEGGPYTLSFKAPSRKYTFSNVWVGEVWLCSGQSNMEFKLHQTATAAADLAAADKCSRVHLYNMPALVPTAAIEWTPAQLDSVNHLRYIQSGTWQMANAQTARDFSAIGYHFARILADSLQCHVGILSNAVGGSACENWIDRSTLEQHLPALLRNWQQNDYIMPWVRQRATFNMRQATQPQRHPYEPAYLFESAILPLSGITLRGVLWYQGESNADNPDLHLQLFPLLQQSWRQHFNDSQLPFYTVQLSSLSTRPSWPQFRNGQRLLAQAPNTWLTVSSDLGDSLDVHPTHKRPVAERLAAAALCHSYHHNVVPSGPCYEGFTTHGAYATLNFSNAQGLRPANGTRLIGFEVAGADGIYHSAEATPQGTTVRLHSPKVSHIYGVRYGWQPFTHANLVNAVGFPASTFRDQKF